MSTSVSAPPIARGKLKIQLVYVVGSGSAAARARFAAARARFAAAREQEINPVSIFFEPIPYPTKISHSE